MSEGMFKNLLGYEHEDRNHPTANLFCNKCGATFNTLADEQEPDCPDCTCASELEKSLAAMMEPVLCGNCNGSGEGMTDRTWCTVCKGSGVVKGDDDES